MKNFEEFEQDKIKEGFDPMIGVTHLLNDPIMMVLVTSWFLKGKFSFSNMKDNANLMMNDFIEYTNLLGYTIDKETLKYKFNELIEKVKSILKK